VYLSNGNR